MNTLLENLSNHLQSASLAALLLDAVLKSIIVLALAGSVCALWRGASAATRHLFWFVAVASLPCLPLLTSVHPAWQKPVWAVSSTASSGNQISLALDLSLTTVAQPASNLPDVLKNSTATPVNAGSQQFAARFNAQWMMFGWLAWLAGTMSVLARVAAGQIARRQVSRPAQSLEDAGWIRLLSECSGTLRLRRPVTLLQSASEVMPMTWGWWRPVVLLPAAAAQWPEARRRVVLLHELAHVKRRDYLTQIVAQFVCAVYWFNPLVWLAARQMCLEREGACDDLVLAGGCKASEYASQLVEIAGSFRRVPQVAAIAMARSPQLAGRIAAIVDASRNRRLRSPAALAMLALIGGIAISLGGTGTNGAGGADIIGQLKRFVAEKQSQANAATNEAAPGFAPFFAAAETGDWLAISNSFEKLREHAGQYENLGKTGDERLRGPRWEAVKEVWGAFCAFGEGDEKYSAAFGRDIITSIPPGSIYFGGTDAGRFIVTAMCRSQVSGDPFFVLTQNALADASYLEYLRDLFGAKIHLPSAEDSQKCFEDYTEDVTRRSQNDKLKPGEDVHQDANGRIQVTGQVAVMEINGRLAKIILDKNPQPEVFIEESFPFDWMYPQLEPHGLIFKLNRQPATTLSNELIQRDHDYWTKYVQPMIGDWLHDDTMLAEVAVFVEKTFGRQDFNGFTGDQRFIQNAYSHRMYSKLRSSTAGFYAWRGNHAADTTDKQRMTREADFAFRQAWALCPYSPESVFRYVNFLLQQKRVDDAILVAETATKLPQAKDNPQLPNLVEQLQRWRSHEALKKR